MAQSLMIQGTGSGVGKSLLVTALCRIFKDMGIDVAPFKAQNMALNSYITLDGGEIGRAQALQAQAARIKPEIDMNPLLLKPAGKAGVQVIIHGKVHSTMEAKGYYGFKHYTLNAVRSSYERLSQGHELIILEGAGSPAEINLMKNDIVNMAMARYAKAPVLLVGDIDKGGVFASFYGTIKLLGRDSRYIKAFILNKFRGDLNLLKPGLRMIKQKTGKPVVGVIPYVRDLHLPEEDGANIEEIQNSKLKFQSSYFKFKKDKSDIQDLIKLVVVKLQYISNFTDFGPFYSDHDVELIYSNNPSEIRHADIVIIPGTKNTLDDLMFLKQTGLTESIKQTYEKGIQIIGICGGYQILGKKLHNPYGVESHYKNLNGLDLLNIETTFHEEKIISQVKAELVESLSVGYKGLNGTKLNGYEIHHGISTGDIGLFKINRISINSKLKAQSAKFILDGSINRNCWGTYMHGIFDNDLFRRHILNQIRIKKGLKPLNSISNYAEATDKAIDRLTDIVKHNIDMKFIKRIVGL